jgi:parallel beta-helix repeat protein
MSKLFTGWTRRAVLAAASVSVLVGFLQVKAYATTRIVRARAKVSPRNFVSVLDFGAIGDGLADDTVAIQAAALASVGRTLYFPAGTYLISSAITNIGVGTTVCGEGWASTIKTVTISHHLLVITAQKVVVRNLKFIGANGSGELNNSCVMFSTGSDYGRVEGCEVTGCAGSAIYLTQTSHVTVRDNYIHDLSGTLPNSADITLYQSTDSCTIDNNTCNGGVSAKYQTGILLQLSATNHKVINNRIGAHLRYGIVDYDVKPSINNNLISGNTVFDIDGSPLGGTSGAGIYTANAGGTVITNNTLKNCNISTTTQTLAPAAIGINGASADILVANNRIISTNWHGVLVVSCTAGKVTVVNNVVSLAKKYGVYVLNSSYAKVDGNTITQAATAAAGAIYCGDTGTTARTGTVVSNNTIEAKFTRAIYLHCQTEFVCVGNLLKVTAPGPALEGLIVENCDNGVISGNVVDTQLNTSYVFLCYNSMAVRVSGNVFKNHGKSGTLVYMTGVCTGTMIDESNFLSDVLNVRNSALGANITISYTSVPVASTWAVGDRVRNSEPAVGQPKAWVCTVAGTPGTWVSEGDL